MDIRQLFARRNEGRVEGDRPPQFGEGVIAISTISKRQSQEVMRFGKTIVEPGGPSERINRLRRPALSNVGERKLVHHTCAAVVELEVSVVVVDGLVVVTHRAT